MSFRTGLGLADRDLVAFAGAGGKSTLLLRLGTELVDSGRRVLLTTTTKMGTDQIPESARRVESVEELESEFEFLLGGVDGPKVLGVAGETVDRAYSAERFDHVLVEADGARRRPLKVPNEEEPVYPSLTSTVVYVVGLSSIGGRIETVAHRPERVAGLLDKSTTDFVSPEDIVSVVTSEQGGLARLPERARLVVVLTGPRSQAAAVADEITVHPRVDRVLVVGRV